MFGNQAANRFATQVHVGLRFHQLDLRIFELTATNYRLAFAAVDLNQPISAQPVNQHESKVVARPLILFAWIPKANDQMLPIARYQLPTQESVNCDLQLPTQTNIPKAAIRFWQSALATLLLALFAFLAGAFFFLLALADDFRFSRSLFLDRDHSHWLFLDDTHGSNHGVRTVEYFHALDRGNV